QCRLQRTIADDVSERGYALLFRGEMHRTKATCLRDIDACDRRHGTGVCRERAPDADTFENEPRAVRKRKRAIAAKGFACGTRIEHDHLEAAIGERQRERCAD